MFSKCFAAILIVCSMLIEFSSQQVVVPAYSAAYYPSAYAYPSVYSPYLPTAAYSPVWAWGSNKNKDASSAPVASGSLLNNQKPTSA
uniref:Nematode Specific Peptide family, group B n=1 Tax=Caenorhabditis tropicalis TaxID=1561998 RepID=A0A1I7U7Q2_9PELO